VSLSVEITRALEGARGRVLVLTGAGVSAESGIPTFRGPEGFWRVGSRNYLPEELATLEAFEKLPDELWAWYLYRRWCCRAAEPNAAHRALVELEERLGDRFTLVTQNVDGLHLRAGNSRARTLEIHGNLDFIRCTAGCTTRARDLVPMPAAFDAWPKERALSLAERELLRCRHCGARARPHVLWFDEFYDEELFRAQSALEAARATDLLLVVGTSGQTTLPMRIAETVCARTKPIVVLNLDESPFDLFARMSGGGVILGKAGESLPEVARRLT
jgi:NAD-dependent deacetylase